MRSAIFQLNIGEKPEFALPIKTVAKYCEKYGIEHIVSTQCKVNQINFYFENLQVHVESQNWDRILYLDADVMVTPNAPNIFEEYPETDVFYAYDEADKTPEMDRDMYVEDTVKVTGIDWPRNERGCYQYFNAGVLLLSAKTKLIPIDEIPEAKEILSFGDQTLLNYHLVKKGHKFVPIDYVWNRMHLGDPDLDGKRFDANFIHYAGPVKYGNYSSKEENIRKDYEHMYGTL